MAGNFNWKDFNPWQRKQDTNPTPNPAPGSAAPGSQEPPKSQRSNPKPKEFVEEIRVSGQNLVAEVERLLREGEVRRLRIKQNNRVLLDLPVVWAALGAVFAPPLAAVAAIAAVVSDCTIEVIRGEDTRPPAPWTKTQAAPRASSPSRPADPNNPDIPKTPDDLSYR